MLTSTGKTTPVTLAIAATTPPRLTVLWPIGWAAALIYGSLLPFDINWAIFGGLLPGGLLSGGLASPSVEDVVINVLLYVPVGLLVALYGAAPKASPLWRLTTAVLVGAAVSLVAENLQAGAASRVASWLDVGLNTLGALTGAMLAIALGRGVAGWIRAIRDRLSSRPCSTLAIGLTLGLLLYGLAPFDFITDTQGLHASFLRARWSLMVAQPAVHGAPPLATLAGELVGFLWFACLGCLHSLARREVHRSPLSSCLGAIRHGLLVAAIVEVLQLFVASQCFELPSLILRSCAVFVGAWYGAFVISGSFSSRVRFRPTDALPGVAWALLAAVQLVALAAGTIGSIRPALAGLDPAVVQWVPFEALRRGSALAAATTGMEKLITFAALGLSVAGLLRCLRVGRVWPLTGFVVGSFAVGAEAVELVTAGGTPDITGPVLAVVSILGIAQLSLLWPRDPAPQPVAALAAR